MQTVETVPSALQTHGFGPAIVVISPGQQPAVPWHAPGY